MLDFIAIALLVIFFIRGYMKGIIVAVFSMLAIVAGIICSLKLSSVLAAYLLEKDWVTTGWAQIVSYLLLFVGVILIVRLIAKALEKTVEAAMLGWANKALGGILYVFVAAMAWSTILWLGNEMHLIPQEKIDDSYTYPYLSELAPWVADKVGTLWPMAKSIFAELEQFFNNVNQSLPQHVDTAR